MTWVRLSQRAVAVLETKKSNPSESREEEKNNLKKERGESCPGLARVFTFGLFCGLFDGGELELQAFNQRFLFFDSLAGFFNEMGRSLFDIARVEHAGVKSI